HRRQPALLDESVLESVGEDLDNIGDETQLEIRKEVLRGCLQHLSSANQELVQLRYFQHQSYVEISRALSRSVGALYVVFNRIHQALAHCIEKGLRAI